MSRCADATKTTELGALGNARQAPEGLTRIVSDLEAVRIRITALRCEGRSDDRADPRGIADVIDEVTRLIQAVDIALRSTPATVGLRAALEARWAVRSAVRAVADLIDDITDGA